MKTIALISTVGGAGRTTLAAMLATLLARRARAVVALDFDPENMLGAYLGLDTLAPNGIGAALAGRPARGTTTRGATTKACSSCRTAS